MKYFVIIICVVFAFTAIVQAEEPTLPVCTVGVNCETGEWGLSAEEIAVYPKPDVEQIYADKNLLYDRVYRRVNGAVDFFNAPNGSVTGTLGAGFNFVTLTNEQAGWAQITEDRWIKTDALTTDVAVSSFAGIYLPEEPLPYPVAWLLVHLQPAAYPGGEPSDSNEMLLRYTLVSLYSTVEVDGWRWYQIGENQWVKQTQVAKVLPVERFEEIDTERWISIDLYEQVLVAYNGDQPFFATLISSGLEQWATNEGLFHVYIRYPRTVMSGAEGQEDFYYLEEVPWTMYFDDDIAVHGAYWHDGFGYRRSHGCVNASITDAHLLYNWAAPEFDFTVPNDTGPAVYVYSSGEYK
jgi:hypothetical protein